MSGRGTGRLGRLDRLGRPLTATIVAALLLVGSASPASAGGWWTYPDIEPRQASPSETVTVTASVLFRTVEEAAEAQDGGAGTYFAYLVRGIDEAALSDAMSRADPGDWLSPPDELILLGPLTIDQRDSNIAVASGTFQVPDVEPGVYDLMLCDRGCNTALADVVPQRGVYIGEPAAVQLLRESQAATEIVQSRLENLSERVEAQLDTIRRTGDEVASLTGQVETAAAAITGLEATIASLEEQGAPPPAEGGGPRLALLGWFVAGIALAVAWAGRRPAHHDHPVAPEPASGTVVSTEPDRTDAPELVTLH